MLSFFYTLQVYEALKLIAKFLMIIFDLKNMYLGL